MIKFKKAIVPALAALLAGVIFAAAANTTFVTSIGDLVFPFKAPLANGTAGTIGDPTRGGMAPVNGSSSYSKTAVTTGFSLTFGNYQADMLLEPSGTLATGYVTLGPSPVDGSKECIFSTQIITTLYVNANVGQSINNAVTTLGALGHACYLYSIGNKTWDRSR